MASNIFQRLLATLVFKQYFNNDWCELSAETLL